jgi:competence protein ComEA
MLAVVGALILAVAGGLYFGRGHSPEPPEPVRSDDGASTTVVVHVSGAVAAPGLVSLAEPARVADAISSAGGATAQADLAAINLAGAVRDGDQIVVPAVGQELPEATGIDLNRSTADQLAQLAGIGPVLAERIVAYREEHGPFDTVEDLLDVPGIGEAKLALLRAGVTAP